MFFLNDLFQFHLSIFNLFEIGISTLFFPFLSIELPRSCAHGHEVCMLTQVDSDFFSLLGVSLGFITRVTSFVDGLFLGLF